MLTKTLVILWLALPLITLANPYHPPVEPCHYHPCPDMVETPEPSSLILVMGTAMIWAGWRLAKRAKGGE